MLLTNQPLESRSPRLWTVSITVAALVLVAVVAAVSLVPRVVAEDKPKQTNAPPIDLGGGVKLEMVLIPEGEFLMGSPDSEKFAVLEKAFPGCGPSPVDARACGALTERA